MMHLTTLVQAIQPGGVAGVFKPGKGLSKCACASITGLTACATPSYRSPGSQRWVAQPAFQWLKAGLAASTKISSSVSAPPASHTGFSPVAVASEQPAAGAQRHEPRATSGGENVWNSW
jgi:hypothetical protein